MSKINRQLKIRQGGNTMGYQPDLYSEDWDKDILGVSDTSNGNAVVFNANGNDYSNAYGTGRCKDECDSLFKGDNTLLKACKNKCKAVCNWKESCKKNPERIPTAEEICSAHVLYNSNCSLKSEAGDLSPKPPSDTSSGGGLGGSKNGARGFKGKRRGRSSEGSSKTAWIVGGVLVLGVAGFIGYKFLKK